MLTKEGAALQLINNTSEQELTEEHFCFLLGFKSSDRDKERI